MQYLTYESMEARSRGLSSWHDLIYAISAVSLGGLGFLRLPQAYFMFDDFVWVNLARQWLYEGLPLWYNPWRVFTPLTHLAYIMNYVLWGDNAPGYYLTNLLLHSLNVVLVYILARCLRFPRLSSAVAAATFAMLFAHFEAIVWITGVIRLLLALFMLSSLITLLLYFQLGKRWMFYVSVLLYAMALLSKEWGIELLGVVFLVTWWKVRGDVTALLKGFRLILKTIWPYLVLTLAYGAFLLWYWHLDAALFPYESTGHMRLGVHIIRNLYVFLGALLLPSPDWDNVRNQLMQILPVALPLLRAATAAAVLGLLVSFGMWLRRGSNISRIFVLWLLGSLLLVSISSAGYPSRYLYIPSIPFCLLFASSIAWLWQKVATSPNRVNRTGLIAALCVFLCGNLAGNWLTTSLMVTNGEIRQTLAEQITEIADQTRGETVAIVGLPPKYIDTIDVTTHFTSAGDLYRLPVIMVDDAQLVDETNLWVFDGQRLLLVSRDDIIP